MRTQLDRSLLTQAASGPENRLLAGVSGAGGSGKSVLLGALDAEFRAAGMTVCRDHALAATVERTDAILLDDAHLLDETVLRGIHDLVIDGHSNLIVGYRPWPRSPALTRLAKALDERHALLVLGPLTAEDVTEAAALADCPDILIDQLMELTGGLPWLVHPLIAATAKTHAPNPAITPDTLHGLFQLVGAELEVVRAEVRMLLTGLSVGFDLNGGLPPGLEHESVGALTAEARAAGLLLPDDRLVPAVRQAILRLTPGHEVRTLQRALVDRLTEDARPLGEVARRLARDGFSDPRVASTLQHAGDRALAADPLLAAELYDEAGSAGGDELAIAARRAQAAAAVGDADTAWHIVDDLLSRDGAPDLRRAVDVAAELWASRGMLSHAADVYRWLGPQRAGASRPSAAVAMIGIGDLSGADTMLIADPNGSPTLVGVAMTVMADGIRSSVRSDSTAALPALVRASDMLTTAHVTSAPMAETPAALAALLAMHSGDLHVAQAVLDGAIAGEQGGAAARARLLLLRAWAAMLDDRLDQARLIVTRLTTSDDELSPRDALLLAALEVGIARRADDGIRLRQAWGRARDAVLHVSMDLYSLLPLGELMIAAARLREPERLRPALSEAWMLLDRLGNPPLWTAMLHWAAVQAAILAERPGELAPHAAALVHSTEQFQLAAVLAAAGRVWLAVLAGEVDAVAVERAARALAGVGLSWDGSRLAGHAAPQAVERKEMTRLLACARDLHRGWAAGDPGALSDSSAGTERADTSRASMAGGEPPGPGAEAGGLSAREREVARLVLEGKTYREIGEAIFISPRTAEHHIARMRQRLGATSRSELLTQLRLALDEDGSAPG